MYPEKDLIVVPECNDEDENPTCWAIQKSSNPFNCG